MQKANHLITGIIIGFVLPAVAWFMVANSVSNIPYLGKPGVVELIAVALNLLLLRFCYKRRAENIGNGIILSTFIFLLAAFILKVKH